MNNNEVLQHTALLRNIRAESCEQQPKKNYYLECVISVQGAAGKVWSGRFDIKMSTGH